MVEHLGEKVEVIALFITVSLKTIKKVGYFSLNIEVYYEGYNNSVKNN